MPKVINRVLNEPFILEEVSVPGPSIANTVSIYNNGRVLYYIDESGVSTPLGSFTSQIDVDFYEGNNPPYIADIDSMGFQDAAGFPSGEDRDVIFKFGANFTLWEKGVDITLVFTPSTTELGTEVRFQLDYIVHEEGELFSGGTSYSQIKDITINANQDEIQESIAFTIPNGQIPSNTSLEVECRLTRLGTDINDTFGGDTGLKHVIVKKS